MEEDRSRLSDMTALWAGRVPDRPSGPAALRLALLAAVRESPEALRGFVANRNCLRLQSELWEDPDLAECIRPGDGAGPPAFPGPDRADRFEQTLTFAGWAHRGWVGCRCVA